MSAPPPIWGMLMETFGIFAPLGRQWWHALDQARWSETVAWRDALLTLQTWGTAETLAERVWTPQQVTTVLERLVQERLLPRWRCNKIMDIVLRHVDCHGQWR